MDLILLPCDEPHPLGEQRLEALATWLIDHGEHVRFFAFLPSAPGLPGDTARRWTLGCLEALTRKYGVEASTLLRPEQLDAATLEALHSRGLLDLILTANAASFDAALDALAAFDRYRAGRAVVARTGRALSCRLWLELAGDGHDYRRLAQAAPWAAVDTPAFTLPPAGTLQTPQPSPLPPLPEHLRSRSTGCQLFELSLTIDGAGGVWLCPLHAGTGAEGRLGDLFRDTPGELLARKPDARGRIGTTSACRRCGLRGRFRWPELERMKPAAAPRLPAPAKPAAAEPAAPLSPEVRVEQPREAEQALEAFEARLDAWSSQLEGWEDEGQA